MNPIFYLNIDEKDMVMGVLPKIHCELHVDKIFVFKRGRLGKL